MDTGGHRYGGYVFRRRLVEHLAPVCALERGVLPRLAAAAL
jgi:hypothetical protein